MPHYVTDQPFQPRRVTVYQPATYGMPYAAAPHLGLGFMQGMPNGGARLRVADRPQPHESYAAKRNPARYTYPQIERKSNRIPSSYRPGKERPRLNGVDWRPTERRMRTTVPLGGRRWEVV